MNRPPLRLRPMPAQAFNQSVVIKPAAYPLSTQGGPNAVTGGGYRFDASVQPTAGRAEWAATAGSMANVPQGVTYYDVLISAAYRDDPAVLALRLGDTIETERNGTLTVQNSVNDAGGLGVVLQITCEGRQ